MAEKRPAIFDHLSETQNLAADELLLAAMEKAEAPYCGYAAEVLIRRRRPAGLTGAVRNFHSLQPESRETIVGQVDALFASLRKAVHSPNDQIVHNVIDIITQSGNQRLAYLLSTALTHTARSVRDKASQGLAHLVEMYFSMEAALCEECANEYDASDEAMLARIHVLSEFREDGQFLVSALEHAVDNFDSHRRSDVLELCMWLAEQMRGVMWGLAASSKSKVGRCMTEILQRSHDKRLVPAFYRAMSYQQFRAPLARVIAQRRDSEFMIELCRHSWLMAVPAIRKGFGFIHRVTWFEGGVDCLLEQDEASVVSGVRFISATGLAMDQKLELYQELLLTGPQPARRAVLWEIRDIESQASTELLRTVLDWQDDDLSPIAFVELMRRHPEGVPGMMVRNLNSRSPSIRIAAGEHVADTSFERYWEGFDELDAEVRLAAGRAMAKVVSDLPRRLRSKLASSNARDQIRGITIIRMLRLQVEMREPLYKLGSARDEMVRSAAVAALGELGGNTSERIADRAVSDSDPRVRANAIEALDEMGSPHVEAAAMAGLDSDAHRVRANAVKVLLQMNVREAAETLLEMLGHSTTGQRISALWVIEKLHLATLMDRVQRMAEDDPDADVRHRAEGIRQKLKSHVAMAEVDS